MAAPAGRAAAGVVDLADAAVDRALALIRQRREQAAKVEGWRTDPVRWAVERLGVTLWSVQQVIARSVAAHRRVAVHSCHGAGKSFLAALLTAWWIDSHPPGKARVVTTAPTGDQVRAILWAEINQLVELAPADAPLPGRVNEVDWKIGKTLVAFGRKPSDYNPHAFQGIHASEGVLVILDEACGIPQQLWTAANAIAANEDSRILAIGNPDDPGSVFARVCKPGSGWATHRISVFDTPNFSGEPVPPVLSRSLVGASYVAEIVDDFGDSSPIYTSKVLGLFPEDSEDGVVPLSALMACCAPTPTPYTPDQLLPVELGVDVGAGGDETAVRERRGPLVGREWRTKTTDAMEVVGRVLTAIRETEATSVKVDVIGIGWGVVGRLRELAKEGKHSARVVGVNVGEVSSRPTVFPRLRSQIWWEIGRGLSESRGWDFSHLEERDRNRLITQLTAPRYAPDSAGRTVVEKKDDTKARIGRSPDNADALLLAYYRPRGDLTGFFDQLNSAA